MRVCPVLGRVVARPDTFDGTEVRIDVGRVPSICAGRSMLRPYEKDGVEIDDASLGGRESQKSRPFARDSG
jgi:hypothetical protein